MEEKHSVSIDAKLYQDIKEYCQLNSLKLNRFVNEMINKQFMIEKYGDAPFADFRKKIEENTIEIDPQIQQAIADNFWEMLESEKEEEIKEEIVEKPKEELPKVTTISEQEKPKKRKLK